MKLKLKYCPGADDPWVMTIDGVIGVHSFPTLSDAVRYIRETYNITEFYAEVPDVNER